MACVHYETKRAYKKAFANKNGGCELYVIFQIHFNATTHKQLRL